VIQAVNDTWQIECCSVYRIQGVSEGIYHAFGRTFLRLHYIYITKNTGIQIWMVTEKMAKEVPMNEGCFTFTAYHISIKRKRD
jgi:hypothetical protein